MSSNENNIATSWLPDWCDESKYPSIDCRDNMKWAWEFLRRNPKYQKLWYEFIEPFYKDGKFDSDAAFDFDVKKQMEQSQEDDLPFVVKNRALIFEEKFGVYPVPPFSEYLNNNQKYIDLKFVNVGLKYHKNIIGLEKQDHGVLKLKDAEIAIYFDLELPIEPQLKSAKHIINQTTKYFRELGIIKARTRNIFQNYRDYLRILDAKTLKIPSRKIAEVIYSELEDEYPNFAGTKKVNDSWKAAKKLRDGGYRGIGLIRK